jgi:ATP-dependent DNA helicase RecG
LRVIKQQAQVFTAPVFNSAESLVEHFLQQLPFELTAAQQRVIGELAADCQRSQPMLRLLQGDVGSGKTVVAAHTALLAVAAGYQVALMAPTELLAEQHYRNFSAWCTPLGVNVQFLTGQLKGVARKKTLQTIADGVAQIIIGTHALFQDAVQFKQLGLVIIDEQHRFGVHQRLALREKAKHTGLRPHQLVMTATPIPRTLAMLQYADLDVSIIDQLPAGRKAIATRVMAADRRPEVIERIRHWVSRQRQVYWVCTLIEESDLLQGEAAEQTAELLAQMLPAVRVGLVHGRLKASDKEAVMHAFKQHQLDLLVATTVIEVGVDVPNAGVMIIENPERLGLAQLHQLRGRVGRGVDDSYCVLLYQAPLSAVARQRLSILRDHTDGFIIAEYDLALRGAGDVLGTRQTGLMQFKIADLNRDADLIEQVTNVGADFFQQYPHTITPLCERWLAQAAVYSEV